MALQVDFTMERSDLVHPGDRVELKEDRCSTMSGTMYYYTIKEAVAMSENLKEPLKKQTGIVLNIEEGTSYKVTVEIDE